MTLLPTPLNHPQTPRRTFSLLPSSLSTTPPPPPHRFSPSQTLTFSHTIISPSSFSLSSRLQYSTHHNPQPQYDHDEEEELVIGDCLVFEEGIFEDPNLQEDFNSNTNTTNPQVTNKFKVEIEPEDLIPDKWKDVQAAINITKKERRKLAQQMEFGCKLEKKKLGLKPIVEEYVTYRDAKLSQLKPLAVENPSFAVDDYVRAKREVREERERGAEGPVSSRRVAPRNPKLAVYGATLEDVSEFLNSGSYDPDAARNSDGPRKLFTKEEKVLLNRRVPDLATATSGKWQPLHSLAASGEFYLVGALLKYNVDINATDEDGLTALHKAILGKKQAIFNLLLRESTNPFVRDKDGATLMHYAVRTASSYMIKILLLYNVDINLQDNDGWTPLHLAVQSRRTDIVKLLLIKRADKTLKNQDGLTPLELCLYSGRDTRTYELIKLFLEFPKSREMIREAKLSSSV